MKKLAILFLLLVLSFSSSLYAEDIGYLKSELEEASRHYNAILLTIQKEQAFLDSQKPGQEDLRKAYLELEEYRKKLVDTNKKNMLKASISAGLDIVSIVGLVNAGNAVVTSVTKGLIYLSVSVGSEALSMAAQAYLNYDAPYNAKVQALKSEVEAVKPDIEQIEKILKMTKEDIKKSGNGADQLGDKGVVFRKFDMLIEAVEKAQKKIYDLWHQGEIARPNFEDDIKNLKAEAKKYRDKIDELSARLMKAEGLAFEQMIKEKQDAAMSSASGVQTAQLVGISLPSRKEMTRQEYRKKMIEKFEEWKQTQYSQAVGIVNSDYKDVAQEEVDDIYSINSLIHEIDDTIETKHIFYEQALTPYNAAWIYIHDMEATKAFIGGLGHIISVYNDNKNIYLPVVKKIPQYLPDLISKCEEIEDKSVELAIVQEKKKKILETVQKANSTGMGIWEQLYGGAFPAEYNLNNTIGQANKSISYSGDNSYYKGDVRSYIKYAVGRKKGLEQLENDAQPVTQAIHNRMGELERAFISIVNERKEKYKEALGVMENADNAYLQLVGTYDQYKDLMANCPWKDTSALKKAQLNTFRETAMCKEILRLAKEGDIKGIDKVKQDFEQMKAQANDLARKYLVAELNLSSYLDDYGSVGYSPIGDLGYGLPDEFKSALYDETRLNELRQKVLMGNQYFTVTGKPGRIEYDLEGSGLYQGFLLLKKIDDDASKLKTMDNDKYKAYIEDIREQEKGIKRSTTEDKQICKVIDDKVKDLAQERENVKGSSQGWAPQLADDTSAEYTVTNIRVNSFSLPNINSVLAFTPNDLGGNMFEITGSLPNIKQITKILISVDGGMTWQGELPVQNNFVYTFTPIEEKVYTPVLKITDEFYTSYTISLLPVQALGIKLSNRDQTRMIRESIQGIAESYEKQNIGAFSSYVSRDFTGNRTYLVEGVRFDFDMFLDIRLILYVNRIEELPSGEYAVDIRWDKTQMPRKTMQEQRTTGNTTILFVNEDGKMKIKNLRGDLLYATLSPEIAEVSGKSVAVVNAIRQAKDSRDPSQPGAGQTELAGGIGALSIQQGTVSVVNGSGVAGSKGFDLDTGQIVSAGAASADLLFEDAMLFSPNASFDESSSSFSALNEAPDVAGADLSGDAINTIVGKVYVFKSSSGNYGKLEILTYTSAVNNVTTFRYAIQPDGSKNIGT